jgi:PAS domain S-box-containing protein
MVEQILQDREETIERSEARETQHRSVLESVKEVIFQVDIDGRLCYLNQAWTELTGYSVKESLGRSFLDFVPPEDREKLDKRFQMILDGDPPRAREARCLARDGGTKWVKLHVRPIVDRVPGISGTMSDITEQKRNETALLQAQKLESLGVLAGGIAHDFNNLLVSIMGNADLASRYMEDPVKAKRHLEQVHTAIDRAAELCRQLLAYSGKGRFLIEVLDLNKIVLEMTHLLRVSIGKGVQLTFDLADNLPSIEADPSQIRQAVMNLVINASEAIGDHDGEICIQTGLGPMTSDPKFRAYLSHDHPQNDSVFLRVQDSGCGMDQETLKRIFDPFFTTKFTGRGLGLAAILGIVRSHRGALLVDSDIGRGTTFCVHFPPATTQAAPEKIADAPDSPLRSSGLILLVEDELTVRDLVKEALEIMGFTVLLASNGQEGVNLFQKQPEEILAVLLDLTMPVMGGEQAFQLIQKIRPGTPVILMSGYSEQEAHHILGNPGMAGFMQKPFKLLELSRTLKRVLTTTNQLAAN